MEENKVDKGLPLKWRERISGKKVIFYNTSISYLLQGKENHINKMKWVFETFQKQRDVVLWWRPHPLELTTVKAMYPELYLLYSQVRNSFVENNIGILDESADMHRAIAISDAYYGDWSSVVHLYRFTGKPVLIGVDSVREYVPRMIYTVVDFLIKDNYMWFVTYTYNYLFCMDMSDFKIVDIIEIPSTYPFKQNLILKLVDTEEGVLLIPGASYSAFHYDLKNKELKEINLKYSDGISYTFGKNDEEDEEFVYKVKRGTNIVYKFKKDGNSCKQLKVGNSDNQYWGIVHGGSYFFLPDIDMKKITVWNEITNEIFEINEFPQNYEVINNYPFSDVIKIDNKLIFFPHCANMIIQVDSEEMTINKCGEGFTDYSFDKGSLFTCAHEHEGIIYAFSDCENQWYLFNERIELKKKVPIKIDEKKKNTILNRSLFETNQNNCIFEGFFEQENDNRFSLVKFLNDINCNYEKLTQENKRENTFGQIIYSKLADK